MWIPNFLLAVFLLVLCYATSETNEDVPKVTLKDGAVIVGRHMETQRGNEFYAFQNIPYAEPPVGELRFKPPVPVKPWSGEKLADREGNACFGQNLFLRNLTIVGSEDCLNLNVYTPEIVEEKKLYPVMVYIYGGGFIIGSCNTDVYGPKRLLDHGIVYVCGNYRLGPFGFLSTFTEECPGNNGLKDQNLILKWVQENIEKFGGDPKNVTIFGQSAGAASVGYHIYSPQSKGLFHKAIMQSGSNFDPWALGNKALALETTKKLTQLLDCPVNETNWKESLDCLRSKTAEKIMATYKDLVKYDFEPAVLFPPVLEPEHEGAFLTQNPQDISIPPSVDIPIIIGMTSDEGISKSVTIINIIKDDFEKKFNEVLPIFLYYDYKPKDIQARITKEIDEFYFDGKHDWSPENHQNLTNLISDTYFTCGQDQFLQHRFAVADKTIVGPTFYYIFEHRGPQSVAGSHYYGVRHSDELGYIFSGSKYELKGDENDDKMKLAMLTMWTDFAKTGNPTPDGSNIPQWIPVDKYSISHAHLGRKTKEDWTVLRNDVGLLENRIKFCRNLEKIK